MCQRCFGKGFTSIPGERGAGCSRDHGDRMAERLLSPWKHLVGPAGPSPARRDRHPSQGMNPPVLTTPHHTTPINVVGEMAGGENGGFRFTGHAGRLHTQN